MQLNDCINFMLTKTQNCTFNYFKRKLEPLGITPAQYAVLKCLWDSAERLPSQLSQELYLDSSTITGILSRMEKKGLVERVHSEVDRRTVIVHILPAGERLRPEIERTIEQANIDVLAGIDAHKLSNFKECLNIINSNMYCLENESD